MLKYRKLKLIIIIKKNYEANLPDKNIKKERKI